MKRHLLWMPIILTFVIAWLSVDTVAADAGIAINKTNFPDDRFRSIVTRQYDSNSDGKLSAGEINFITQISVEGESVYNLQGIEYFKELTALYCSRNMLSELNLNGNPKITILRCGGNNIKNLDLRKNTKITELLCEGCLLDSLNIQNCKELVYLDCSGNHLKSIDISNCPKIERLICSGNQIESVEISANKSITYFDCSKNSIKNIDIRNHPSLSSLLCTRNSGLTTIAARSCQNLKEIICSECGLSSLDIVGCSILSKLDCRSNSLLSLDLNGCHNLLLAVENGTKYSYSGYIDYQGRGSRLFMSSVTTLRITPENVPKLTASLKENQVHLDWEIAERATSYLIQRQKNNETWETINSSYKSSSYIDSRIEEGSQYRYRIKSRNIDGFSVSYVYSNIVAIPFSPSRIESISAIAKKGEINITWTKSNNSSKYILQRRVVGETNWRTLNSGIVSTSFTDTTIVENTLYQYRVRGRNGSVYGPFSLSSSVRSLKSDDRPGHISSITTQSESGRIRVMWTTSTNATQYIIQRRVVGESTWKTLTSVISKPSYVDSSVVGNTLYQYRVRGRNGASYGAFNYSNSVRAITVSKAPGTIVNISASVSNGMITIRWESALYATGYIIQRSFDGGENWATISSNCISTAYADTTIKKGQKCYYRVRGRNNSGFGKFSNIVFVTAK